DLRPCKPHPFLAQRGIPCGLPEPAGVLVTRRRLFRLDCDHARWNRRMVSVVSRISPHWSRRHSGLRCVRPRQPGALRSRAAVGAYVRDELDHPGRGHGRRIGACRGDAANGAQHVWTAFSSMKPDESRELISARRLLSEFEREMTSPGAEAKLS